MKDPLEKMLLDQRAIAIAQLDRIDAMLSAGGFAVPSRGAVGKSADLTVFEKILNVLTDHPAGLMSNRLHEEYEKKYGEINIKHLRSSLSLMKDKGLVTLSGDGIWSEK